MSLPVPGPWAAAGPCPRAWRTPTLLPKLRGPLRTPLLRNSSLSARGGRRRKGGARTWDHALRPEDREARGCRPQVCGHLGVKVPAIQGHRAEFSSRDLSSPGRPLPRRRVWTVKQHPASRSEGSEADAWTHFPVRHPPCRQSKLPSVTWGGDGPLLELPATPSEY